VRTLNIVHVYGSLGTLPAWESEPNRAFGLKLEPTGAFASYVAECAKTLRTFTESREGTTPIRDKIDKMLLGAETLVFLGFGFHQQNVDILQAWKGTSIKTVLSTAMGMSNRSQELINEDIRKIIQTQAQRIELLDGKCSALIDAELISLAR